MEFNFKTIPIYYYKYSKPTMNPVAVCTEKCLQLKKAIRTKTAKTRVRLLILQVQGDTITLFIS
jgi:hypothetical protein